MAVQLKFCMVGAAGAIIHRNPRSTQWDYVRLVEEIETAYGPSSQHAAAVAIELRQRVRKPGEALHVLRDDIYGRVSVAYSNRADAEQDAIGVEVFTNALGQGCPTFFGPRSTLKVDSVSRSTKPYRKP